MKFLTLLLLIGTCQAQYVYAGFNAPAAASGCTGYTLVQNKGVGSSCGTSSCSLTVTSTGSGHIIVAAAEYVNATGLTISSISGGSGTYTHCSNCHATDSNGNQVDMSYTLNSTSGATTITVNLSGSPSGIFVVSAVEMSCTGTPTFDVSNSTTHTTCTSCGSPSLTLTGSGAEGIVEIITPNGTTSDAGSPFHTNFLSIVSGDAGQSFAATTTTSFNWTTTSGTSAVAGIAFK